MYTSHERPTENSPLARRLIYLRAQMREAIQRAEKDSDKWNARKEANSKNYAAGVDLRMACKADLEMGDALAGCKFHMEAAQTYAAAIAAEIEVDRIAQERGSGNG